MADEQTIETHDDTPGGEYPKMLYRGDSAPNADGYDLGECETITVASSTEEKAARANGYGDLASLGKKAAKASG
jgi:hypothetical protein